MHLNRMIWILSLLAFCLTIILSTGCNKKTISLRERTPEAQFEEAKRIFEKRDYYKAKMQFTVIVLNNPGHRIIEEAQFYLAESHFHLKEYIEAIAEYEKLIRSMPQSQFVDNARYKIGLCYYELSPMYALDQEYTQKAISQFQLFIEEFPNSEMRSEVGKKLQEAQIKLAKKQYKTGELYRKMGYYRAAVLSYDFVLNEFTNTPFIDDALYWKGECSLKLMEWQDAVESFEALIENYGSSSYTDNARIKLNMARKKLANTPMQEES